MRSAPVLILAARLAGASLLSPLVAAEPGAARLFAIRVVDADTGRGVPLVELRATSQAAWWTDSAGLAAIDDPGLLGRKVFFHVGSHGYQFPADGFGFRGKALDVAPGGEARLEMKRTLAAERLYRITGEGIYRDSVLLGRPVPLRHPLLNGQVAGSDSVMTAVFRGKIHWYWGDTNRLSYPLGNFHVPGAVSALPGAGGLDPEVGVDLEYLVDEQGFARPTAKMPGEGPTWITGLSVVREPDGRERLFSGFMKVRNYLEVYRRGLCELDPEKGEFALTVEFEEGAAAYPDGHTFEREVDGVRWIHFATPYPLTRVRADAASLQRLASYESYTPLQPGSRASAPRLDRGEDGRLRWGWKADTTAMGPELQARLLREGHLRPGEEMLALRDADTGKPVVAHGGSVAWNGWRGRWVMVFVEIGGTSHLGELWFAEADSPLGPWVYARKVATHERYSFYNPKHHPFLDKEGGRVIFFEGTYTMTFSGNNTPTPRYDYNQVMHRLDLADPRLVLPVPVYRLEGERGAERLAFRKDVPRQPRRPPIAFFALERPRPGSIPIPGAGNAHFHALPADLKDPPAATVPLFELQGPGGSSRYTVDPALTIPGHRRREAPVARVWPDPIPQVDLGPF